MGIRWQLKWAVHTHPLLLVVAERFWPLCAQRCGANRYRQITDSPHPITKIPRSATGEWRHTTWGFDPQILLGDKTLLRPGWYSELIMISPSDSLLLTVSPLGFSTCQLCISYHLQAIFPWWRNRDYGCKEAPGRKMTSSVESLLMVSLSFQWASASYLAPFKWVINVFQSACYSGNAFPSNNGVFRNEYDPLDGIWRPHFCLGCLFYTLYLGLSVLPSKARSRVWFWFASAAFGDKNGLREFRLFKIVDRK